MRNAGGVGYGTVLGELNPGGRREERVGRTALRTPWVNGAGLEEEEWYLAFRRGVVGIDSDIQTPCGTRKLLYADWTASGRLYRPIETYLAERVGPHVGNTHTGSSHTGRAMTAAYQAALDTVRRHVNAGPRDAVLFSGTGMTGAVNKLQRLMGLRVPEWARRRFLLTERERPVIFVTHMEHHSNQISWLETVGEVVIVPPDSAGLVSPDHWRRVLQAYANRPHKIGAFTTCSNVTGIRTPVAELARVLHRAGALAVADFSASAPYAPIDMHPADPEGRLDAVLFSPHKFLGGPGTGGVLVLDGRLVASPVPDQPGGGTVSWTDPWGGRQYVDRLEEREDGGTPGFLQAVRTALCIRLKEAMGHDRMAARERKLLGILWNRLLQIPGVRILEARHPDRQAVVSFTVESVPPMLATKLLNDRFGIQARGGCSCAGSYGHYLLGIGPELSAQLQAEVLAGIPDRKPGWVRVSLHPVMTEEEAAFIGEAVAAVARFGREWAADYVKEPGTGEYRHRAEGNATLGSELILGAPLF